MDLLTTIEIYAGGPGSGCDPDAARRAGNKCGRPPERGSILKDAQEFDDFEESAKWIVNVDGQVARVEGEEHMFEIARRGWGKGQKGNYM